MLKTIVLLSVALNILVQSDASSWPKRYDNKDINIDDPQVGMYEGSADFASGHDDDDDEDIGRQLNPFPSVKPAQPSAPSDDEELVISGDGPVPASSPATPPRSHCQMKYDLATNPMVLGGYVPQCSSQGEYHPTQCHAGTGYCWCVDKSGDEDDDEEYRNKLNQMPGHRDRDEAHPTWDPESNNIPEGSMYMHREPVSYERSYLFGHPGLLAAIIGGAVFGLLCAVLLVMFIVYRMRKKDEGSYPLDERKRPPVGYTRAYQREMYA